VIFQKEGIMMKDDENANVGDAIIGIAIIAVIIWGVILLVKGIIALFVYTFGLVERLVKGIILSIEGVCNTLIDLYSVHHEYILSTEFLTQSLAVVGAVYLFSQVFIPFCKLVDSLMEIVVVLPFMMIGWAYDILCGTFLFIQKALVRPWNPDYNNGAPSFENRGLNN